MSGTSTGDFGHPDGHHDTDPDPLRPRLPWRLLMPIVMAALCVLTGAYTVRRCFEAIERARAEATQEARDIAATRIDAVKACSAYGEWTAREVTWIDGFGCVERGGNIVGLQ